MNTYGHAYLTSYGWNGSGTALRKGAIARPLAIPPKKNLCGVGKDRDEAFPFWDHLFAAASKAITIRVSSDDEAEGGDDSEGPCTDTPLQRTTTGILSNRRPVSGTPTSASTSTSGTTTPHTGTGADTPPNLPILSLLSTAKRDAAKRGLYARFFRGPVLGPDTEAEPVSPHDQRNDQENPITHGSKTERKERKKLKKERRERKAVRRAEKAAKRAARAAVAVEKDNSRDRPDQNEQRRKSESESSHRRKRAREGDDLSHIRKQEGTALPPTKKKKKKRKDTLP